jgi:hypothetical protein
MSRRSKADQAGVGHIAEAAMVARQRIADIKQADAGIDAVRAAAEAIERFERWSIEAGEQLRRDLIEAIAPKAPAAAEGPTA